MAATKKAAVKDGKEEDDSGVGLWEGILKEVASGSKPPDANLLLLGRPGIGKRTILQALLNHACPAAAAAEASLEGEQIHSRSTGIDYAYFGARDPAEHDAAQAPDFVCPSATSVLLCEDPKLESVLMSRLGGMSFEQFRHTAALICLDLKEPWTMMEDFQTWLKVLQNVTADIMKTIPLEQQDELRSLMTKVLANYQEPKDGEEPDAAPDGVEPTLLMNLGLPVIVAVLRADGASALETQKTVGWSETIEAHLRSECLQYGATIVYTQVQAKNVHNVDVLYDYMMHRLFGYTLRQAPKVPSRDSLFVPAGWDSQQKVDAAAAALEGGLERSFESVVVNLEPNFAEAKPPEECEDMQAFLKRSALVLQKLGGASATGARRAGGGGADGAKLEKRTSNLDLSGGAAARRTSNEAAGPGGEGPPGTDNASLQNFFQNLLTRGAPDGAPGAPGTPGAPGAPAPAAPMAPTTSTSSAKPAVTIKIPDADGGAADGAKDS